MHLFVGVSNVTTMLFFYSVRLYKRKTSWNIVSFLFLQYTIINGSSINSWRRSCFHTPRFKTNRNKLLRNSKRSTVSHSSATALFLTNMYNPIHKGPACQNHSLRHYFTSIGRFNTNNPIFFYN